jgi:hypothetical protein
MSVDWLSRHARDFLMLAVSVANKPFYQQSLTFRALLVIGRAYVSMVNTRDKKH